jgi:CheY-like chemotaxis protein
VLVLIVDDELDFRESLRDAFEDEGYDVATAANGVDALRLLGALPSVSLVILDLVMPELGGVEVYCAMQEDPRLAEIPVIIATSNPSAAPSGAKVMTKPLQLRTLLAEVARRARPDTPA